MEYFFYFTFFWSIFGLVSMSWVFLRVERGKEFYIIMGEWVCLYVYLCVYICEFVYLCVYMCESVCIYGVCGYGCMFIYVFMVFMYIFMCLYVCLCICCWCVCLCVFTCVCTMSVYVCIFRVERVVGFIFVKLLICLWVSR